MQKTLSLTILTVLLCIPGACPLRAEGTGVPYFRNYTSKEYHAHNRNYDVACDDYGTVYVANFEGLLYYDGVSWRKIHTPGISRVTRLARGRDGRIWVGGYNVFGYLTADRQGRLRLNTIVSDAVRGGLSEVDFIKVTDRRVYVHTTSGKGYYVDGNRLVVMPRQDAGLFAAAGDSVSRLRLPLGRTLTYSHDSGISFGDGNASWMPLSERDGLVSNYINYLTFDRRHTIWGVTDKGVFTLDAVSPYSQLTERQGLKGEVNCITQLGRTVYLGTMEGLFAVSGHRVERVGDIDLACWQFDDVDDNTVYAATSAGLYVTSGGTVRRLTQGNTFSVCMAADGRECYTGEVDGVYHNTTEGVRRKVSDIEKVMRLKRRGPLLEAETIHGELWRINLTTGQETCLRQKPDPKQPKIALTDTFGTSWQTDMYGGNLTVTSPNSNARILGLWIHPLRQRTLNALHVCRDGTIWAGGDFGAVIINGAQLTSIDRGQPQPPYIRQVTVMGDSVYWGGYTPEGLKPVTQLRDISLPSHCRNVSIRFSTMQNAVFSPVLYRYRVNGGAWSRWSEDNDVDFNNVTYGRAEVEVQALDPFGRLSPAATVEWYVSFPLYLRWWAMIIYAAVLVTLVWRILKWRTERLKREKEKLESIVSQRTAQLSDTLDNLRRTQNDLVRMERTATAGKLTQGLIDRILNPINYINNFSRLTTGLAADLHANIEDEKEHLSADNYDDCEDILDMMRQNLKKIEEHGVNTTRTLRAMEAMLNNHSGKLSPQDITPLCRQVVEVANDYYKADIARSGAVITLSVPPEPVNVEMHAESMNRILLALIANSMHAMMKKYAAATYTPQASLTVTQNGGEVQVAVRDNGIGIEDTIREKIFDPFFTTKPTGEAAGVGLYLVRELVQDHHGRIGVTSEKNVFCEFVITLPACQGQGEASI